MTKEWKKLPRLHIRHFFLWVVKCICYLVINYQKGGINWDNYRLRSLRSLNDLRFTKLFQRDSFCKKALIISRRIGHENFGCSLYPWPAAYWKAMSDCISSLQARTYACLSPGSRLKHFPSTSSVPNVKKRQEKANPRKSISTIGNKQSISWKEWPSFKSVYKVSLKVLLLNPQSWGTIPTFHDFDEDSHPISIFSAYETCHSTTSSEKPFSDTSVWAEVFVCSFLLPCVRLCGLHSLPFIVGVCLCTAPFSRLGLCSSWPLNKLIFSESKHQV